MSVCFLKVMYPLITYFPALSVPPSPQVFESSAVYLKQPFFSTDFRQIAFFILPKP